MAPMLFLVLLSLTIPATHAGEDRNRVLGEIIPVKAELSRTLNDDEGTYGVEHSVDLDWETIGRAETVDDVSWFKLSLGEVHCVHEVFWYDEPSKPWLTWICSETDCFTCEGDDCNMANPITVTVSTEGATPDNLPPLSDCRYGDTVKLEQADAVIGVAEFVITEHQKDWIPVDESEQGTQRTAKIEHDLESIALQFKTDSTAGSEDGLRIIFENEDNQYAGRFNIYFTNPIKYMIEYCNEEAQEFPASLPSDDDRIWTIGATNEPRITLHCNGVEVVNFLLTDDTCQSESNWGTYWNRDVATIRLSSPHATFEGYRPRKVCGKPDIADSTLQPNTDIINSGEAYTVTCGDGFTISGSPAVTCLSEGQLSDLPTCQPVRERPVSAGQSHTLDNDNEKNAADHAIDLDLATSSVADAGPDGTIWLMVKLENVKCIARVVEYNSDGSLQYTWTCTDTDCSTCVGGRCDILSLTVSNERTIPDNLPILSDCKYGDTVKLQLTNVDYNLEVYEIALFGKQDEDDSDNDEGGEENEGDAEGRHNYSHATRRKINIVILANLLWAVILIM